MGLTGSEIAADGSFFSSRQRWIQRTSGFSVNGREKSVKSSAKMPTRGSNARGL